MSLAAFARARAPVASPFSRRTIPFDYHFRFKVFDEKDEKKSFVNGLLSETVTVSVEASFTAVSIGYGLLPRLRPPIRFGPSEVEDMDMPPPGAQAPPPPDMSAPEGVSVSSSFFALRDLIRARLQPVVSEAAVLEATPTLLERRRFLEALLEFERPILTPPRPPRRIALGEVFNSLNRALGEEEFSLRGQIGPQAMRVLTRGIRLNPSVAEAALLDDGHLPVTAELLAELFETIEAPPERIQFLYALRDEGTGREFQSEFLLNTAGLGISDGQRPFRYFAVPITFSPRATIRLNIIPKSDFKGELYVVLHGYKVLGGAGTPTGRKLRPRQRVRRFRAR